VMDDRQFTDQLTDSLWHLRAFARSLCHDTMWVEDLVQQTILQAWAARDRVRPDTRVRPWLFTILRNCHYADIRRRKREIEDPGGDIAASIPVAPDHDVDNSAAELYAALQALTDQQREALTLFVNRGLSYAEVSRICGCKEGTIKSRIARARTQLRRSLEGDAPHCNQLHTK
jgi:RNA polymerase sigma-70 factor, ECF subfamily